MLESSKVPALTRAIDILNLIARIGPCSAATIIDTLGIPKSTAYLLLNELRRQRFLSLDHQENFCLWTRLVELSGHALSKMDRSFFSLIESSVPGSTIPQLWEF